jgi:sec-independent protein translocase protein TatA
MSIGGSEILLILLAVLLLFGSKRIPEVARMMGKGMSEFRKATDEIKREINESTKEVSKDINEIKKDLKG